MKVDRIANKDAQAYVDRAEPFQGSNMFGEYDHVEEWEGVIGWQNPFKVLICLANMTTLRNGKV